MAAPDRGSFGAFHVRADLGAGRFGPVYRGEAADTGDPVVIRTVQAALPPAQREALLESLQWLCGTPLDHPSIGQPLACGVEGETPFLVHSFVSGTPLDEFLDRDGPQPVDDTIVRLTQLAGAVDFAAAAGVLHGAVDHRDIVLGANHTAIAGFGLAQAAGQAGLSIEASSPYQSPQQRAGEPPAHADDVYALAVVALQLLCGRAADDDVPAAMLDLLREAGLSPALHDVFQAALADDRAERPASALAFAAAFQAAAAPAGDDAGASDAAPFDTAPFDTAPFDTAPFDAAAYEAAAYDAAGVSSAPMDDVPMRTGAADSDAASAGSGDPVALPLMLDLPLTGAGSLDPPGEIPEMPVSSGMSRPERSGRGHGPSWPDAAVDAGADPFEWRMLPATDPVPVATPAPLPFDPGVDDFRGGDGSTDADHHPARFSDPGEWQDEWDAGAAPVPVPSSRGRAPFEAAEPSPQRRSYAVAAAVLAVLLLAGVAGGLLVGRTSESVPFPRSAPQVSGERSGAITPGTGADEVAGTGRTVVPEGPAIPEPVAPPEPVDEPLAPPAGAAPGAETERAQAGEPPATIAEAPAPARPPAASQPAPPPPAAQTPVPAPRPEPPPGRVLVRSTPAGAQVLVNGEPRGNTPLAVRELPFGAHTIVVTHPSYGSRQQRVTLTAEVPARSLDFELDRPAPASPGGAATAGALQVESRPAGAQVFVNERFMGTTPLVLPEMAAGEHVVRLELPGYRRWTTSVTVTSGERARVAASLEQ